MPIRVYPKTIAVSLLVVSIAGLVWSRKAPVEPSRWEKFLAETPRWVPSTERKEPVKISLRLAAAWDELHGPLLRAEQWGPAEFERIKN